ncbi:MAG: hypothetical protein V1841_00535 [Patescibacteria group bacterium]
MEISKKLPQFNEEKVLIITVGGLEMKFYLAQDGVIEEVSEFKLSRPQFKDKPGFFMSRGTNKVFRASSVELPIKRKLEKSFLENFRKIIQRIFNKNIDSEKKIDYLYIFSPPHLFNKVKEELPVAFSRKVKKYFKGDYFHKHPFEILGEIEKAKRGPTTFAREEEEKIFKESEQARKFSRGRKR